MARVEVARRAEVDIEAIIDIIEAGSGTVVAAKWLRTFETAIVRLDRFPNYGSKRPQLGNGVRCITRRPYLIFYRLVDDSVYVQRVLDARRRITRKLIREA